MDPLKDTRLSLRARGLFLTYLSLGEVLPALKMQQIVLEGRDAIRKAMSELKEFGYIEEIRYQTGYGHWNVILRFTKDWNTGNGFSGHLNSCTGYIANSDIALTIFSNENIARTSGAPREEEFVDMAWPGFEDQTETETKLRTTKLRQVLEDDAVGSVGKLPEDKKALRQSKYTKSKIRAASASSTRQERPEDEWTTSDILGEFYDLTRKHAPGAPSQVNGKSLASWINQRVGQGTPRKAVLIAVRMFFADPRLVRDPGVGTPFWRRFIAYYPTVHGIVTAGVDNRYEDVETTAHQEKMLKLLEG